jgi:hypothetical protein
MSDQGARVTAPTYSVGLDLGQQKDSTAIAIVEVAHAPDPVRPARQCNHYGVRHLERLPLGTSYPAVVERVSGLIRTPPLPGSPLAVDQTGVGRPVVDLLRQATLPCRLVPVTITFGGLAHQEGRDWRVPKKDLVGVLLVLLQSDRLRMNRKKIPLAEVLAKELANFRVKVTANANETFESLRESDHDDLVLALALACWAAERYPVIGPGSLVTSVQQWAPALMQPSRGVFGEHREFAQGRLW